MDVDPDEAAPPVHMDIEPDGAAQPGIAAQGHRYPTRSKRRKVVNKTDGHKEEEEPLPVAKRRRRSRRQPERHSSDKEPLAKRGVRKKRIQRWQSIPRHRSWEGERGERDARSEANQFVNKIQFQKVTLEDMLRPVILPNGKVWDLTGIGKNKKGNTVLRLRPRKNEPSVEGVGVSSNPDTGQHMSNLLPSNTPDVWNHEMRQPAEQTAGETAQSIPHADAQSLSVNPTEALKLPNPETGQSSESAAQPTHRVEPVNVMERLEFRGPEAGQSSESAAQPTHRVEPVNVMEGLEFWGPETGQSSNAAPMEPPRDRTLGQLRRQAEMDSYFDALEEQIYGPEVFQTVPPSVPGQGPTIHPNPADPPFDSRKPLKPGPIFVMGQDPTKSRRPAIQRDAHRPRPYEKKRPAHMAPDESTDAEIITKFVQSHPTGSSATAVRQPPEMPFTILHSGQPIPLNNEFQMNIGRHPGHPLAEVQPEPSAEGGGGAEPMQSTPFTPVPPTQPAEVQPEPSAEGGGGAEPFQSTPFTPVPPTQPAEVQPEPSAEGGGGAEPFQSTPFTPVPPTQPAEVQPEPSAEGGGGAEPFQSTPFTPVQPTQPTEAIYSPHNLHLEVPVQTTETPKGGKTSWSHVPPIVPFVTIEHDPAAGPAMDCGPDGFGGTETSKHAQVPVLKPDPTTEHGAAAKHAMDDDVGGTETSRHAEVPVSEPDLTSKHDAAAGHAMGDDFGGVETSKRAEVSEPTDIAEAIEQDRPAGMTPAEPIRTVRRKVELTEEQDVDAPAGRPFVPKASPTPAMTGKTEPKAPSPSSPAVPRSDPTGASVPDVASAAGAASVPPENAASEYPQPTLAAIPPEALRSFFSYFEQGNGQGSAGHTFEQFMANLQTAIPAQSSIPTRSPPSTNPPVPETSKWSNDPQNRSEIGPDTPILRMFSSESLEGTHESMGHPMDVDAEPVTGSGGVPTANPDSEPQRTDTNKGKGKGKGKGKAVHFATDEPPQPTAAPTNHSPSATSAKPTSSSTKLPMAFAKHPVSAQPSTNSIGLNFVRPMKPMPSVKKSVKKSAPMNDVPPEQPSATSARVSSSGVPLSSKKPPPSSQGPPSAGIPPPAGAPQPARAPPPNKAPNVPPSAQAPPSMGVPPPASSKARTAKPPPPSQGPSAGIPPPAGAPQPARAPPPNKAPNVPPSAQAQPSAGSPAAASGKAHSAKPPRTASGKAKAASSARAPPSERISPPTGVPPAASAKGRDAKAAPSPASSKGPRTAKVPPPFSAEVPPSSVPPHAPRAAKVPPSSKVPPLPKRPPPEKPRPSANAPGSSKPANSTKDPPAAKKPPPAKPGPSKTKPQAKPPPPADDGMNVDPPGDPDVHEQLSVIRRQLRDMETKLDITLNRSRQSQGSTPIPDSSPGAGPSSKKSGGMHSDATDKPTAEQKKGKRPGKRPRRTIHGFIEGHRDAEPRDYQTLLLQGNVREFALTMFDRLDTDSPFPPPPTQEELDTFFLSGEGGPSEDNFRLDFTRDRSPWNRQLAVVFAELFVESDQYEEEDESLIASTFLTHIKTLRSQATKIKHKPSGIFKRKRTLAAQRQARRSRREDLYTRRLAAAAFFKDQLPAAPSLIALLKGPGMSDDESDHQGSRRGGIRRYDIVASAWRSPELSLWLRIIDLLYIHTKFRDTDTAAPGNWVRIRNPSNRIQQGTPVSGLSRNFYNPTWLANLSLSVQAELNIQPNADFRIPDALLRTVSLAARYIHVESGHIAPLNPDDVDLADLENWLVTGKTFEQKEKEAEDDGGVEEEGAEVKDDGEAEVEEGADEEGDGVDEGVGEGDEDVDDGDGVNEGLDKDVEMDGQADEDSKRSDEDVDMDDATAEDAAWSTESESDEGQATTANVQGDEAEGAEGAWSTDEDE
ncbi:hypothetical protein BV25DRAFT_1921530 [Artomyces pyxidatus]|uniref:Uncharacterized protein n=1 Tax=Artomyces pyxidatus TaxID=48021 RepID=A0ACB8SIT9_9AGAM|nr:hypothetical protein BV25DRAFT_1921530 [Artomyces pyxidatus]